MRVLIVKLSSLGDVVQTFPVLNDLRRNLRGVLIDWVVEEAFAPLLDEVVGVERILAIAQRRWRRRLFDTDMQDERRDFLAKLRLEPYGAVIDFQGLVKSALVARQARLAPGGHRYTYGNGSELCGYEWPVRFLVDRPVPMERRVHAVRRYRLLAARALGYAIDGVPPRVDWRFAVAPGDRRDVLIAHGTTRVDNEWPEPDWVEIGRRLVAAGFRVVLPHAGERETLRVQRLALAIGPAAVELLAPMPIDAIARRMAGCVGVIGVDSGLSHLAVALDLVHVQIFSQPRARRAGPVDSSYQLPVGGDAAPSVDAVWAAWDQAWAARPVPAGR
ncbi:MAG: lipopolysaccharide heptosyltransferase I [Caldimonas sp.]